MSPLKDFNLHTYCDIEGPSEGIFLCFSTSTNNTFLHQLIMPSIVIVKEISIQILYID